MAMGMEHRLGRGYIAGRVCDITWTLQQPEQHLPTSGRHDRLMQILFWCLLDRRNAVFPCHVQGIVSDVELDDGAVGAKHLLRDGQNICRAIPSRSASVSGTLAT